MGSLLSKHSNNSGILPGMTFGMLHALTLTSCVFLCALDAVEPISVTPFSTAIQRTQLVLYCTYMYCMSTTKQYSQAPTLTCDYGIHITFQAANVVHPLRHLYRYGLVPNGGRVYYSRRSQPPLLTQMVELYFNATGNVTFLAELLPYLVREHEFWLTNRSIEVDTHTLIRYAAETTEPR